ncbi:hypothetical protein E2C01_013478 [Portunus trituberculatus]|uniref:Uncharacterized protein n=1 Tax=Portunus trituberculatus TaxID=210409 RepID=A0A5B7DGR4_PORTR|nr:hypothetical protein [Portunus trituberculatus]
MLHKQNYSHYKFLDMSPWKKYEHNVEHQTCCPVQLMRFGLTCVLCSLVMVVVPLITNTCDGRRQLCGTQSSHELHAR